VPPAEDLGTGDGVSGAAYIALISTAHWFVGIGCAAHQLPSTFYPACTFDEVSTAMDVFLDSFPDVPASTTFTNR
jgi:hypothetical protein